MGIFETMRVSASGLTAQRLRMDVIASNVANVETTTTPEGGPYRRRQVVFQATTPAPTPRTPTVAHHIAAIRRGPNAGQGVKVTAITEDEEAVKRVYDPDHPDADEDGFVLHPDIDVVTEVTDMLAASRAYEANITVLNATKAMAMRALSIGRA